mmetsp:Transcript_9781/g.13641  ORF Transcript_9781/g.13641 Transcript_9781/m.13641 type:complete len:204 (+) Transcript_9781:506-1117(+)
MFLINFCFALSFAAFLSSLNISASLFRVSGLSNDHLLPSFVSVSLTPTFGSKSSRTSSQIFIILFISAFFVRREFFASSRSLFRNSTNTSRISFTASSLLPEPSVAKPTLSLGIRPKILSIHEVYLRISLRRKGLNAGLFVLESTIRRYFCPSVIRSEMIFMTLGQSKLSQSASCTFDFISRNVLFNFLSASDHFWLICEGCF